MITREDIQATCDDIVREFSPVQVILFGSYTYGTPTEDSDVDLLVIMDIPESDTRRQAVEILQRIPHRFSMDLVAPIIPAWEVWDANLLILSRHAVDFRYPGKSATNEDAELATQICAEVPKQFDRN